MRRAKIVATLGPATSSYEMVRAIIDAGVDVARLNLSHGDYSVHDANFANVRKAAEDAGRPVAALVDLQGPKIRLGKFENGPHDLLPGDIFKITIEDIPGTKEIVSTTFKGLPLDVKPGDFLLIDDGKVRVKVLETDGTVVTTEVIVGGAVHLIGKDDANARRGEHLVIVDHERLGDSGLDALDDVGYIAFGSGAVEQDRELVAAEPSDDVAGPERRL